MYNHTRGNGQTHNLRRLTGAFWKLADCFDLCFRDFIRKKKKKYFLQGHTISTEPGSRVCVFIKRVTALQRDSLVAEPGPELGVMLGAGVPRPLMSLASCLPTSSSSNPTSHTHRACLFA